MSAHLETCSFLDLPREGQSLYTCSYLPSAPTGPGVVIAPPIGRERLRCYRELANLARHLASLGHPVLRFDYRGEGESSGKFERLNLSSRVQDIGYAVSELRRLAGVDEVCLLGLRLGAVLALMASPKVKARHLILVDPICNPRGQAATLLRANVVLQTHYTGKVSRDSPTLRAALDKGEAVPVYGFMVGKPLLDELESLDPAPLLDAFMGHADLLYIAPKDVKPKRDLGRWLDRLGPERAQARCVKMAFSWTSRRRWTPSLDALNEAVAQCLMQGLEVTR
jgi:alpha/beta superfamily hydrolase